MGATSYLCAKWNSPFQAHLAEVRSKVVFINLLRYVGSKSPSFSEIAYRGIAADAGFADEPWLAEMERKLHRMGLFNGFRVEVEGEAEQPWVEVRRQPFVALPYMAQALCKVAPDEWACVELAQSAIDAQRNVKINPAWLGPRLGEEADAVEPGRLLLLLDEVGQQLEVVQIED